MINDGDIVLSSSALKLKAYSILFPSSKPHIICNIFWHDLIIYHLLANK